MIRQALASEHGVVIGLRSVELRARERPPGSARVSTERKPSGRENSLRDTIDAGPEAGWQDYYANREGGKRRELALSVGIETSPRLRRPQGRTAKRTSVSPATPRP